MCSSGFRVIMRPMLTMYFIVCFATGANPPPALRGGAGTTGRISNLYLGGIPISAQPSAHSVGAGQYRDRFPDESTALKACRSSKSCKGYERHCRAVPYILTQVPCKSDTTMLCDESTRCADSNSKCMTTFECESESPLFDSKTTWMYSKPDHMALLEEHSETGGDSDSPTSRKAGDALYTAGDVLNQPKPSPEAIDYGNMLLKKQRMLPLDSNGVGSLNEALPHLHLFKSEQEAVSACKSRHKCKVCEGREIRAERVGADNSLYTWGCMAIDEEKSSGVSLMSGFNSRTGLPTYTRVNTFGPDDGLGYRSSASRKLGVGQRSANIYPDQVTILPSPTEQHPTKLAPESLYDPVEEEKKRRATGGLFAQK